MSHNLTRKCWSQDNTKFLKIREIGEMQFNLGRQNVTEFALFALFLGESKRHGFC